MSGLEFLGKTVRDITSGFTGTAIQTMEHLNGNVQIAIQPKMADDANTMPDAMFIDSHMLDIVDDGISNRVTPVKDPTTIVLGEEVTDEITGFAGIATMKATYINGCESLYVEEKHDKSKEKPESGRWIQTIRAKHKGKGKSEVIAAKKPDGKPTGGPGAKVQRQSVQR